MPIIRWVAVVLASTGLAAGCRPSAQGAPVPVAGSASGPAASRAVLKCGLDPDAAGIRLTAKPMTVAELSTIVLPASITGNLEDYPNRRLGELERQVWRVRARIKSIQLRPDGDYYVEIEAPDGAQSVVEVPDPAGCQGSALAPSIASARRVLSDRYHPTTAKLEPGDVATFEGVGFWGFRGRPTGARLMPGLAVSFGQ